jgi:hypothetical protein
MWEADSFFVTLVAIVIALGIFGMWMRRWY